MDLFNTLNDHFNKSEEESKNQAPSGLCPVCWGYQQYDGKLRILFEDKQIDVNNHKRKYMRIQKLLKEHIEGIQLKEGEIKSCPKCNGKAED